MGMQIQNTQTIKIILLRICILYFSTLEECCGRGGCVESRDDKILVISNKVRNLLYVKFSESILCKGFLLTSR